MRLTILFALLAIASFHLACLTPQLSFLMFPFVLLVVQLARTLGPRPGFYLVLAIALACYVPHLFFFFGIFRIFAFPLWIILALPLALFGLLVNRAHHLLPKALALVAIPFLFTGLEYARCELYYLRFAWLTPGLAFANSPLTQTLGSYGIGFLLASAAAILLALPPRASLAFAACVMLGLGFVSQPAGAPPVGSTAAKLRITGIQLEMACEGELLAALDRAFAQHPDTDLFMLPEYSLVSPPTPALKDWCMRHQRHLIVGGKEPVHPSLGAPSRAVTPFCNTAFVIGPAGDIVFSQAKSVPIQFFVDGLPATEQKLWHSPWGRMGILICYDLSYTRVVDNLVRQGAQALLVPTMDAESWGRYQHELHARIAPARAAEYGIPIARVASSGISQFVTSGGNVIASAPFPGQGEILSAELSVAGSARLPPDRYLAPACTLITLLLVPAMCIAHFASRRRLKTASRVSLPAYPGPGARMPPGSTADP